MTSGGHLLDHLSLTSPRSTTYCGTELEYWQVWINNHVTLDASPFSPTLYAGTTRTASAGSDKSIGRYTNKSIEQTKNKAWGKSPPRLNRLRDMQSMYPTQAKPEKHQGETGEIKND